MSAQLRSPGGPFPSPPIISFYAECSDCSQIGLFATVDGFLACNWRLDEHFEEVDVRRAGLFIVRAHCSRCREGSGRGKSLLKLMNGGSK